MSELLEIGMRKRTTKACDSCHEKRIKCNWNQEKNKCKNCLEKDLNCTFHKPVNKRGPISKARKETGSKISPIAISSLLTSHENQPFNVDDFVSITVDNIELDWLEAYFQNVHPKYPFLPDKWSRSNWKNLPMFLLHSMYTLTLHSLSHLNPHFKPQIDFHYSKSKEYLEMNLKEPTPLDLAAMLLTAFYGVMFTDEIASGINWIQKSIDLVQKIEFKSYIVRWITPTKKEMAFSASYSYQFLQLLNLCLAESDNNSSLLRRTDFHFKNFDFDIYVPIENQVYYNRYYSSNIWSWFFGLMFISNTFLKEKSKGNEIMVKAELKNWYINLPFWLKTPPPPQPNTDDYIFKQHCYMLIVYHGLRLYVYKEDFIQEIKNGSNTSTLIKTCIEDSAAITHLTYQISLVDPNFTTIPIFIYFWNFIAAAYNCVSIKLKGPSPNLVQNIDFSIHIIEILSKYTPLMSRRVKTLHDWKIDPDAGINEFQFAF